MLFDPSRQNDRDRAISDFIDPNGGGWNVQNKWQLLQFFQGDALRVYEISLQCETKRKLEASLVITRKVHDPAFENRRIGEANMIAIKTEQDRYTGRQATCERTMSKEPKMLANLMATAQSQTHFLDAPNIRAATEPSDLDFAALKSQKVTVYLVMLSLPLCSVPSL